MPIVPIGGGGWSPRVDDSGPPAPADTEAQRRAEAEKTARAREAAEDRAFELYSTGRQSTLDGADLSSGYGFSQMGVTPNLNNRAEVTKYLARIATLEGRPGGTQSAEYQALARHKPFLLMAQKSFAMKDAEAARAKQTAEDPAFAAYTAGNRSTIDGADLSSGHGVPKYTTPNLKDRASVKTYLDRLRQIEGDPKRNTEELRILASYKPALLDAQRNFDVVDGVQRMKNATRAVEATAKKVQAEWVTGPIVDTTGMKPRDAMTALETGMDRLRALLEKPQEPHVQAEIKTRIRAYQELWVRNAAGSPIERPSDTFNLTRAPSVKSVRYAEAWARYGGFVPTSELAASSNSPELFSARCIDKLNYPTMGADSKGVAQTGTASAVDESIRLSNAQRRLHAVDGFFSAVAAIGGGSDETVENWGQVGEVLQGTAVPLAEGAIANAAKNRKTSAMERDEASLSPARRTDARPPTPPAPPPPNPTSPRQVVSIGQAPTGGIEKNPGAAPPRIRLDDASPPSPAAKPPDQGIKTPKNNESVRPPLYRPEVKPKTLAVDPLAPVPNARPKAVAPAMHASGGAPASPPSSATPSAPPSSISAAPRPLRFSADGARKITPPETPATAPPINRPLPRDPAQQAAYARTQVTPSGKRWWSPELTFEEFVAHFRASKPNDSTSTAALRVEYDAGGRLNPETGKIKYMAVPVRRAVYETAPDEARSEEVRADDRPGLAKAGKDCNRARAAATAAPNDPVAQKALKDASQKLGDVGSAAYVKSRYPGPPPPELIYPPKDHEGESKTGDFDRVYRVADKYGRNRVVVEAKGNGSQLGKRVVGVDKDGVKIEAEQGTGGYLRDVAKNMAESKTDPELRRVGKELELAIKRRQVEYIEVRTTAGEPLPTIVGRRFDTDAKTGTR